MATHTDDELIAAYESGDESGFSTLVSRYLPEVYSFALRLTGSREDAEDISQYTFVKAWKNLSHFKKGMRMKTWLFSIARNTAIDMFRKKRPALFSDFANDDDSMSMEERIADPTPDAEKQFDQALSAKTLDAALAKIAPPYREILLLHYYGEMTLAEAAKTLGIPLNTAKSRDRRALAALRKVLEPETAL